MGLNDICCVVYRAVKRLRRTEGSSSTYLLWIIGRCIDIALHGMTG